MNYIKIFNYKLNRILHEGTQLENHDEWLQENISLNSWGKPEREIVSLSEPYEKSDVIYSRIERTNEIAIVYVTIRKKLENGEFEPDREILESSEEYSEEEIVSTRTEESFTEVNYVTLKPEYEITITDLTKDAKWLLSECLRKRKEEYPTVEEIVESLMEKYGENRPEKFAELHAKRMAVKLKYPKP